MKYIKTYENLEIEPKVGDYVICDDSSAKDHIILRDFINNNIGRLNHIDKEDPMPYDIEYKNIPYELSSFYFGFNGRKNNRIMNRTEIIYFSKSKEDVEQYLQNKKFNL